MSEFQNRILTIKIRYYVSASLLGPVSSPPVVDAVVSAQTFPYVLFSFEQTWGQLLLKVIYYNYNYFVIALLQLQLQLLLKIIITITITITFEM